MTDVCDQYPRSRWPPVVWTDMTDKHELREWRTDRYVTTASYATADELLDAVEHLAYALPEAWPS